MYSEYEKYLLGIRNSLIQNGIEFPEATKESMDYLELFKLGNKLSDILLYYKVLAISGSGDGLEDFILPINTSYVDKMRGICYSEFVTSVLPDYKALSLGIEPEEEPDDIDFEEEEVDTSKVADSSEDLFNSMFEEDEEDGINNEDLGNNSIEDKFDANVKQLLQESNIKYVPNGVYVEDIKSLTDTAKDEVEGNYSDDDFDFSEDEDNYEDTEYPENEGYLESNYSEDDDDFDFSEDEESDYSEDEDYEESDYSEDDSDEDFDYSEDEESDYNNGDEEFDYSEDDSYEESDYSEGDYEESDYSEDDESDYSEEEESDYSEDDEDFDYSDDDYEESDYSEGDESDYNDGYAESDYSEDDESDYSTNEENDNLEGYESQVKSEGVSTPVGKSKDLSDELQDITNTVLTNIKRKAVNFLKRKE